MLPLYTPGAAAELLAVRESWLRRKAAARAVPCTFLGRHLRFSRADLEAIAQGAAQPPLTTRRPQTDRVMNPAPDVVSVDELSAADRASRPARGRSEERSPRRRGPNKTSRQRRAAAATVEAGWGRAA